MRNRISLALCGLNANRPGFYLGTVLLTALNVLLWLCGAQTSLTLGPGGEFPSLKGLTTYAFSHEDLTSLVCNTSLLVWLGSCQEQRWDDETSRISGFSAVQLALFTAQSQQMKQKRLLGCVPIWLLPWFLLVLHFFLLPGTPGMLHFCAICLGYNYTPSLIGIIQRLEVPWLSSFLPVWAYVSVRARFQLPTHNIQQRSEDHIQPPTVEVSDLLTSTQFDSFTSPKQQSAVSMITSDTQALEDEMLRAGILASLQYSTEEEKKVEVPKSSVSSLRLQQLQKMGFATEKAVVALAATAQLDGAISLLINGQVGEEAVVISKGKKNPHS
ncbi:rhomboid domain-containing protein 3 isoform X2 [Alosa sapidissima]|uniref:rhomboid domain-containing protein 3 isoform X2 n=1 Tax=Alosa sapidissima TaxID=34773 RepID=UPI001C0852CB|nr:rhomboid domain-containing protein 3 isoform X2 [Alosa sapidissima]